ncbi:MAG TPA: hypothetical protein VFL82_02370 [Thermomicrobiales bacterium]|nr:hypothetical protein [Thermomicrobiales bacterium]
MHRAPQRIVDLTTTRRTFLSGMAIAALSGALVRRGSVFAQGATPAGGSALAGLGVPEVSIKITDAGFEGVPDQLSAGWVLLTVENDSQLTGETGDANFVMPPAGTTADDVRALFAPPSATPAAASASPTGDGGEQLPEWLYQAAWAGAALVPYNQTVSSLIELTPGDWIVTNDSPGAPYQLPTVKVTGDAGSPTPAPAITADVTVELAEFAFGGVQNGVPAGKHVWKFSNIGKQPHIMVIGKGPEGLTMDQIMTMMSLPEGATPPPDFPYKESDFDFAEPGIGALSPGKTSYAEMDLEAGTYFALCFVTDPKSGMPHAMLGMIAIFTAA